MVGREDSKRKKPKNLLGTIIFVGGEREKKNEEKEIKPSMLRQKRRYYLEMKIETVLKKKFPFRFNNFSEKKDIKITTNYVFSPL